MLVHARSPSARSGAAAGRGQPRSATRRRPPTRRRRRSATRISPQRGIATREQLDTTRTHRGGARGDRRRRSRRGREREGPAAVRDDPRADLRPHRRADGARQATSCAPTTRRRSSSINQVTPIYVSFAIPEARLPDLKRYMAQGTLGVEARRAQRRAAARRSGRITFVDNAVDPTTGTIKVKGTFPNGDRRLWPGQFVNVVGDADRRIRTRSSCRRPRCRPASRGTYVFVVKPDQTVELRPVTVARTRGDETVIEDGLSAGRNRRHRRSAAARAGQPRQHQVGAGGRARRRHEPLRALHQAARSRRR